MNNMPDKIDINNVQAAIDAGKLIGALVDSPIVLKDPTSIGIVPHGYSAIALEPIVEKFLPTPRRVRTHVNFDNALSFVSYVNAYKLTSTKVFVTRQPSVHAVIDYHASQSGPAWCEHRASYTPVPTEEWKRWEASNRQKMNQFQFATFLEDNADLVMDPPGAALLELVANLEAKVDISCNQLVRLQNGRTRVNYDEVIELQGGSTVKKQSMELPESLISGIAPFDGGPVWKIKSRLRYRLESKQLVFWYEIVDKHLVIKDAVDGIVKLITEKTGIEPLYGSFIN